MNNMLLKYRPVIFKYNRGVENKKLSIKWVWSEGYLKIHFYLK